MSVFQNENCNEVYATLKAYLDEKGLHYREEDGRIYLGFRGNDLLIHLFFRIDDRRQVLALDSQLPIDIPEDKYTEVAMALSAINYSLMLGNFYLYMDNGTVWYKMTASFRECAVGSELIADILNCSYDTVENYNDKIEGIVKGEIELDAFLEELL